MPLPTKPQCVSDLMVSASKMSCFGVSSWKSKTKLFFLQSSHHSPVIQVEIYHGGRKQHVNLSLSRSPTAFLLIFLWWEIQLSLSPSFFLYSLTWTLWPWSTPPSLYLTLTTAHTVHLHYMQLKEPPFLWCWKLFMENVGNQTKVALKLSTGRDLW